MKRKTIVKQGRRMAVAVCGLLIGASMMQSCEDDVLTGQPEWLGNSIYERLQDEGNYTTMLRLIDDMGQKEILSRTGSKTLFVADDAAFNDWFQNNSWGVKSYDDLSVSQRRVLLKSAMINNAYLVELLSNISGTPPQQGMCMRRSTALTYTDSIPLIYPEDMPTTAAWKEHLNRTDGMYIFKDDTPQPMIHFLPAFMRTNKITDEDLMTLTNGQSNSISDAWVNGKRIAERDITCKNGYVQKIEGVLESAPNMAEIIRQNQNMKLWSHLIDRFSAPYHWGGLYINEATRQVKIDSVFVMRYFAELGPKGRLEYYPDGVTTAAATLKFDPGWNEYKLKSSDATGLNKDAAAMIVPTDEALDYWWNHDGMALQEEYKTWDSIPDLVLSKLINVNMLPSLVESVPSKFASVLDDAKMEMGITTADIDSCYMGCNGVVYLANRVFMPREYSSVSFPALIHQDVMSIIYWAINNLDLAPYLNSMESRYSLIIPTNNAMLHYIDPTSYRESVQFLYEFMYDASAAESSRIKANRYKIERDTLTGEYVKTAVIGTVTSNPSEQANKVNQVRNRLEDLINSLIVVGDIEDGHEYYKTKAGTMIRVQNAGVEGQMTISGGYQMETGTPLTVTKIYDMSKTGNGKTYIIDEAPVMGATTSVFKTLENHPEFNTFLNLLNGSDGNVKNDLLVATSGSVPYRTIDKNMRLFDKYNYTVYVPTNESIQKLIDDGYLPTWDDFDAQTLEVWNDDKEKMDSAKSVIANRIISFVRYHIQDNAVAIGAYDEHAEVAGGARYETAKLNPLNNRFFALDVALDNGSKSLTVTDQMKNVRHVVKDNNLYNLMCREYWFSGGTVGSTGRSINSASDAVVHQIDGPLLFDNSLTSKTWQQEIEDIKNAN